MSTCLKNVFATVNRHGVRTIHRWASLDQFLSSSASYPCMKSFRGTSYVPIYTDGGNGPNPLSQRACFLGLRLLSCKAMSPVSRQRTVLQSCPWKHLCFGILKQSVAVRAVSSCPFLPRPISVHLCGGLCVRLSIRNAQLSLSVDWHPGVAKQELQSASTNISSGP